MKEFLPFDFSLLKLFIGGIGAFIAQSLGGNDVLIQGIYTLIVIDYATGLLMALYNKKLSSEIGYKGIIKKILMLFVIAMAHNVEVTLPIDVPIRNTVVIMYYVNEGISILENVSFAIPIPKQLIEVLEKVKS